MTSKEYQHYKLFNAELQEEIQISLELPVRLREVDTLLQQKMQEMGKGDFTEKWEISRAWTGPME